MERKRNPQSPWQQEAEIKDFLDMIAPGIIKFNTGHFLCGSA